jgi:hypothetical protein
MSLLVTRWRSVEFAVKPWKDLKAVYILGEVDDVIQVSNAECDRYNVNYAMRTNGTIYKCKQQVILCECIKCQSMAAGLCLLLPWCFRSLKTAKLP